MELFLGVDGGQSSTTALIGDASGRVLGHGQSGPCNHVGAAEGKTKLIEAVTGCVRQACERAGIEWQTVRFKAACFGMSGGPDDKEAILRELLPAERWVVTHDGMIALAGSMGGEPGVIIIAGTGSLAFGRGPDGRTARAGGWGYVFGDEGGAFDITRQALRAALRMEEGWGSFTALRERLLDATGVPNANDLLHRFYTTAFPRPRIASLSQVVSTAAEDGDRVAREILGQAAQHLASFVAAVRHQLFDEGASVPVCAIGGVFKSALVRERFRLLVELGDGNRVQEPKYGPAVGALLEAYRAWGLRPELSHVPRLDE
ncbi:MAG: N-acetylglucosamine kinase [Bryobacteraceae bacterium]